MAKINLTTQHNQENLRAVASLGVLICLIATLAGIKLWWFKHRLSFEQKNSPNTSGANNGRPPTAVLVPRRSKQPKYKKDKRYSQQIYESVEVHGVFRQKPEDDVEIQRPLQLPPVRMRQTSENDAFPIRPPPRIKRRDQVHSTAFEDLEIATLPGLVTASSLDLSIIPEINTKITLTFEEFERQFNLKEKSPGLTQPTSTNNETNETPKPPLRLNRSSSTMTKPEKPERFLKLSQSITVPEIHKVTEKRSIGLSSPKEDLTKIDTYEKAKMFGSFAQPKISSTGYIKYEEVDNDLHERELNAEADIQDCNFIDSGFYDSPTTATALTALRNESFHDLHQTTPVQSIKEFNFNRKPYKTNEWEEEDFSKQTFITESNEINKFGLKDSNYYQNNEYSTGKTKKTIALEKDFKSFEKNFVTESQTFKAETISQNKDHISDNEQQSNEKENPIMMENEKAIYLEEPIIYGKKFKTELHTPTEYEITGNYCQTNESTIFAVPLANHEQDNKIHSVADQKSQELLQNSCIKTDIHERSVSFEEDFDSQFENWPQFEEKIDTPQVSVRRFNNCNSFGVNDDRETSSIYSATNEDGNDAKAVASLKERRPTGYAIHRPESPEFDDIEEWQEAFNNKFNNQVRSFKTAELLTNFADREASFETSVLRQIENRSNKSLAIKQRRPTGYFTQNEHFLTLTDDSDEDIRNDDALRSNLETHTVQLPKVKFEDADFGSEHEIEKFTLNQRRPTGFVNLFNKHQSEEMFENRVKFDETTVFKEAETNEQSIIKQRRPTGFIKQLEMLDLSDNETTKEDAIKDFKSEAVFQSRPTAAESPVKQRRPTGFIRQVISPDSPNIRYLETDNHFGNSENKAIYLVRQEDSLDSPTVRYLQTDKEFRDDETNTESLIKQRRPTGYGQLFPHEKQVSFQLDSENIELSSQRNEALQQRRPTGFIKQEDIIKQVNFQLTQNLQDDEKSDYGNEQLKQRRPTGFVNRKELKCLDQPAPICLPATDVNSKQDFDDHLWQELEKDVAQDVSHNFEEEFAKIRQSYELNEADFLERKDESQKSPTDVKQQPLGFGKSIEDDWENFELLKKQVIMKPSSTPEDNIKITFSDNDLNNTTSILKDSKLEEDMQSKPRKSKVTFDFKTEEHVIPARRSHNHTEDTDFDDDIPPQPVKRASNINYNNETTLTPILAIPTSITLFGNQISIEDKKVEDSWSIIRKHRNTSNELQKFSTDSSQSLQAASSNGPPKPAYRNPMAQLAIQRAKEVRADMDGFKSRSINDRKPEASSRQKQKLFNLSNTDHGEGTEA